MNVYCRGKWSPMYEKDGWLWCSDCDTALWRTTATFEVDNARVSSPHGREEDGIAGREEDAGAWGAVQA